MLAPIMVVIKMTILLFVFVLSISTSLLSILSSLLGLIAVLVFFVDSGMNGVWLMIMAWLISPYGIPKAAEWLVDRMDGLWTSIQNAIYS